MADLLIYKILHGILYFENRKLLHCFVQSHGELLKLSKVQLYYIFHVVPRDLCIGNIFFDLLYLFILERGKLIIFNCKASVGWFWLQQELIYWGNFGKNLSDANFTSFYESLLTKFNCFYDEIKTWAG